MSPRDYLDEMWRLVRARGKQLDTVETFNMILRVHHCLPRVTTLGPCCRFAIWVQGCHRHCPGCLAPETWAFDGGSEVDVLTIADTIIASVDIEGLTISGGEPFGQAPALVVLIDAVKSKRNIGVILYTGYRIEELQVNEESGIPELLSRIDLLIDGPYERVMDDGRSLRGSSNQRVLALTPRYEQYTESIYGIDGRKVEVFSERDTVSYAGIPSVMFLKAWKSTANGG
jgi:anaerobic ribonucleoside-triphosphate reductase activating protein